MIEPIRIGDCLVGDGQNPCIVAEMGINRQPGQEPLLNIQAYAPGEVLS